MQVREGLKAQARELRISNSLEPQAEHIENSSERLKTLLRVFKTSEALPGKLNITVGPLRLAENLFENTLSML